MVSPAKLYLISNKVSKEDAYLNKYTYSAFKFNYPHIRIMTTHDLVSNNIKRGVDIPKYLADFIGEEGKVLLIANIVNKEVPYVQLRSLKTKRFSVYGSQTKLFYGMGFLDSSFKYGDPILLVEGTMDYNMAYAFYKNSLATMTAGLTSMQFEILKLLTDKVILAYDNDEAGNKAKVRDGKKLKKEGFEVRYLSHYSGFKDLGDLADVLLSQDELKFNVCSTYYSSQVKSLVNSLKGGL